MSINQKIINRHLKKTLELVAYISESKRAYRGLVFGEEMFSDDHFFWEVFFRRREKG